MSGGGIVPRCRELGGGCLTRHRGKPMQLPFLYRADFCLSLGANRAFSRHLAIAWLIPAPRPGAGGKRAATRGAFQSGDTRAAPGFPVICGSHCATRSAPSVGPAAAALRARRVRVERDLGRSTRCGCRSAGSAGLRSTRGSGTSRTRPPADPRQKRRDHAPGRSGASPPGIGSPSSRIRNARALIPVLRPRARQARGHARHRRVRRRC